MDPRSRKPDTGTIRPYRPCPADFRETYLRNGWQGPDGAIEDIYGTNWRCIRRWIEECGGDELRAERSRRTGCVLRPEKRTAIERASLGARGLAHFTITEACHGAL